MRNTSKLIVSLHIVVVWGTPQESVALAAALFDIFHRLGIQCHHTKLQADPVLCIQCYGTKPQADPVSCIQHLGFTVDVAGRWLLLCAWQYEKLLAWVTSLLKESCHCKRVVGKRTLAQVVDYLQSMGPAIP